MTLKVIAEDRYGWPIEILIEDFKTAKTAFEKQGADPAEVKTYIDAFKKLRDEQKIKDADEKNIDKWAKKPFEELKAFVDDLKSDVSRTQAIKLQKKQKQEPKSKLPLMKGADLVAENDEWWVYRITDHKASVAYGVPNQPPKYQGWCISNTNPKHWNEYGRNSNFYFYIRKNPIGDDFDKIAARVTVDGTTYFDMQDKELEDFPADNEPKVRFELPERKIVVNGKLMPLDEFMRSKNLKVGGSLDLRDTPITSLPSGLNVGGSLWLSGTKITSLPVGLKVGGNLDLSLTKIKSLPADLEVGGNLDLSGTKITSLPADLKVGGYLDLSYTKISSLPAGLKVGGSLHIQGTRIKDEDIPKHLKKKVIG